MAVFKTRTSFLLLPNGKGKALDIHVQPSEIEDFERSTNDLIITKTGQSPYVISSWVLGMVRKGLCHRLLVTSAGIRITGLCHQAQQIMGINWRKKKIETCLSHINNPDRKNLNWYSINYHDTITAWACLWKTNNSKSLSFLTTDMTPHVQSLNT